MTSDPYRIHQLPGCEVLVLQGANPIVADDDNVDVEIRLPNGNRYGATFFTLQNVATLMSRWAATGECSGGLYFVAQHAIVVRELTTDTILKVVADLQRSGEFSKWCERLDDTAANKALNPTGNKPAT
jgi:hypothetical protein